ncbi:MAG: adenylate/guanylate cyclase domain-containing protein [Rhodospirillaceae bacterium]|nr:adenylate/guanylate cyclase domain-containing protein [Rhodospirillaceae bacterium]
MTSEIDRPYPLRRRFRRRILPAFLILLLLIPALAGWGGAGLIEAVYLQLAERRAAVIDRAVATEAGAGWQALKTAQSPEQLYLSKDGARLRLALENEVRELALSHLKIYGVGGKILFDTIPKNIGTIDASEAFRSAMQKGERNAIFKTRDDGTTLYELYVRLPGKGNVPPVVFELYEPTSHLNRLLIQATAPVVLSAALVLLALIWALSRLVGQAQNDIDGRTALVTELRSRLEGFVSNSAISAARNSVGSGSIQSERILLTLFYSDIRGFTSFSEELEPEQVVSFLNKIMSLQIEIVREEGGDVDKMIGDALLVRFDGAGCEGRAVRAAGRIQEKIQAVGLHPGIGIGVYTGEVISGAIGPEDRQDFTVIGDSVNASARLCEAAGEGEVVVDSNTVEVSGIKGFGAVEEIVVKGKKKSILVRRLA